MKLGFTIKKEGEDQVLDIRLEKRGTFEAFLVSGTQLIGKVSRVDEFLFHFPPGVAKLSRIIRECAANGLCDVPIRDSDVVLVRPLTWESAAEILDRLRHSKYNGADAFAPAVRGYIPKLKSWNEWEPYWFKVQLPHLKWFCVFCLEYPRMELWCRTGVSDACEKLAEELEDMRSRQGHRHNE
jgi:hypothetical protein